MKINKSFVGAFLFLFLVGLVSAASGGYTYSNPKVSGSSSMFTSYNSNFGSSFYDTSFFDNSMCEEGQDFLIRVDATKCSPVIVRSDLLEEEDIPVFCPVQAIKINPLIDISSIDSISFHGDYPPMVKTVGFTPAYTALGGNRKLNNYQWDNIGYVTIILRNEPNESAMPDFVDLNLTARITYDLRGGFGLMTHSFYLPVMDDYTFNQEMGKYAFFNHMGYVRADEVGEDSARISLYRDLYRNPMNSDSNEKQRLQSFDLDVGESSPKIALPGFECLSKVQFKLKSVDFADTSANFVVNSEYFEAREEQTFLNGLCTVKDISNVGLYQSTRIYCPETDEGSKTFDLRVSPKLVFDLDGETVEASLGEKLGRSKKGEDLFLAYVGEKTIDGKRVLQAMVVAVPAEKGKQKLLDSDLDAAAFLGDLEMKESSLAGKYLMGFSGVSVEFYKYIQAGEGFPWFVQDKSKEYSGSKITLSSLGVNKNEVLSSEIKKDYIRAVEDYNLIASNYLGEKYPESEQETITLAEIAMDNKINLASKLRQFEDVKQFCLDFKTGFASSKLNIPLCDDDLFLSNEGVSTASIVVDGDYKEIVFNGVFEPDVEDYGALILVRNINTKETQTYTLKKNSKVMLPDSNSGEYFSLIKVNDNSVQISYKLDNLKTSAQANKIVSSVSSLSVGSVASFNDKYEFVLQKVYLNKMAYVEVKPTRGYESSEATFNHKIGIEKRLIQLSPEKARSIANKVNNTIGTLESITAGLDVVTETMKKACLATGGFLTLKNILANSNGESIARGEVMKVWKDECKDQVPSKYRSLEPCYLDHSDEIDNQVKEMAIIIGEQEDTLNNLISSSNLVIKEGGFFGEDLINSTALAIKYSSTIIGELKELIQIKGSTIYNSSVKTDYSIDLSKVIEILEKESNAENIYGVEDLQKIDKYYKLYVAEDNDDKLKEIYYQKLYSAIDQIVVNEKKYSEYEENKKKYVHSQDEKQYVFPEDKGATVGRYLGYKIQEKDLNGDMGKNLLGKAAQAVLIDGNGYWVILDTTRAVQGKYDIKQVYNESNGVDLGGPGLSIVSSKFKYFESITSASYNYEIAGSDYKIRYYESGQYKALPAIVPFDKKHGWYTKVEVSLTSTTSYADSGKVESFKLCNVMADGLIGPEDTCQTIPLSNSKNIDYTGITERSESQRLIDRAVKAISAAGQASSRKGAIKLGDDGETVPVGEPYPLTGSVSKATCSDYMSPKECQLLFNLCDPVICPESRCDYGGKYPVRNVIQSGVIGSAMLCAPNVDEGIVVPVCVTGVNAGLKAFNSGLRDYRDCLVESAETGRTVGICDEIHSIYMCEFFWKQAIPLAKIAAPAVLNKVLDTQGTRGGSEYFSMKEAWANAQESIKYFTESYAVQSNKAFKARSTEQVGTEACKTFVSVAFPTSLGSLDVLTESDNPPQFTATFEEIPYSSATNPAMSQYKVYFHIYSGTDTGVYYSVYLRGADGSYYEDSAVGHRVDSGYIASGNYASETVDFLGPVGYTQLCVRINDQEECGFGKVSTSFAINYLRDAYVKKQAGQTDIKSEQECISGTSNLLSMLDLNLQNGLENTISPEIAAQGITRICSTGNPGEGSDPNYGDLKNQKWLEVGHCGDENMKCWIDTVSLKKAFKWEYSYNDTLNSSLSEAYESTVDNFLKKNGLWSDSEFESFVTNNLSKTSLPQENISLVENAFDLLSFNNHKAFSILVRGNAYRDLALKAWSIYEKLLEEQRRLKEQQDAYDKVTVNQNDIFDVIEAKGYRSPVFYLSSFEGEDLFVAYVDGGWRFKIGRDIYSSMTSTGGAQVKTYPINTQLVEMSRDYSLLDNKTGSASSEMKVFLVGLEKKDYFAGMQEILRVMGIEQNGLYGVEELITRSGDISVDEDKKFEVSLGEEKVYFSYDGGWKWSVYESIDLSEWMSISENSQVYLSTWDKISNFFSSIFVTKDISFFVFPEEYDSLRVALKGKGEPEGALIIFEGESFWKKAGVVEVSGSVYDGLINKYSKEYGVDPYLVMAVMKQESNFNPYAVSSTGAAGLMQFTRDTANNVNYNGIFGETVISCSNSCSCSINCDKADTINLCGCSASDPRFNAEKSINAGSKYLAKLVADYSVVGDDAEKFALAAYNGGPGVSNKLVKDLQDKGREITWSNAKSTLDAEFLKTFADYKDWSESKRENKIKQITEYVDKVLGYKSAFEVSGYVSGIIEPISSGGAISEITSPGQRILSIARSKIGEDTVRKDGSLDNPCASFVSNVLIGAGALEENCYSEAVIGLYNEFNSDVDYKKVYANEWGKMLMAGDIIIWGGEVADGWKPEFQHITIFSDYDSQGNFVVIHDGGEKNWNGLAKTISETTYSKVAHDSRAWYITHVYRYVGEVSGALTEYSGFSAVPAGSYTGVKQDIFYYVKEDNLEKVQEFLNEGVATINSVDNQGKALLDYAPVGGKVEDYLKSFGAKKSSELVFDMGGLTDVEKILILRANNWPVQSTLDFVKNLDGKYDDNEINKAFVDKIYADGVITKSSFNDIAGNGGWIFNSVNDMGDVYILLLKVQKEKGLSKEGYFKK